MLMFTTTHREILKSADRRYEILFHEKLFIQSELATERNTNKRLYGMLECRDDEIRELRRYIEQIAVDRDPKTGRYVSREDKGQHGVPGAQQ